MIFETEMFNAIIPRLGGILKDIPAREFIRETDFFNR